MYTEKMATILKTNYTVLTLDFLEILTSIIYCSSWLEGVGRVIWVSEWGCVALLNRISPTLNTKKPTDVDELAIH